MVRLYLLAPTRCEGPGGIDISALPRSPKRLALLAYLVCATPRGFHRRDTLTGMLWPESDDSHARATLRQTVLHLRSDLGGAVSSRGRDEVGVDRRAIWCDAIAFEDGLVRDPAIALRLYGQDLLEGFHLSGAPEFERWLDGESRRLRRLASDAARSLAGSSQTRESVRWARRALDLTPYDEQVALRLFGLLARRGDRAGAVREYDRFSDRLREDLGLAPSPETQSFMGSVRARSGPEGNGPRDGFSDLDSFPDPEPIAPTELEASVEPAPMPVTSPPREGHRAGESMWVRRSVMIAAIALAIGGAVGAARLLDTTMRAVRFESPARLTDGLGPETDPAISPDGRRIVYTAGATSRLGIVQREIDGDRAVLTEDLPGSHHHPAWSPDGKQIAFITDLDGWSKLQVMILGGAARTVHVSDEGLIVYAPAWSPDGARIAFTVGTTLFAVSVATRSLQPH